MLERSMTILSAWFSRLLYNQEDLDPKKRSIKDPYLLVPVCAAQMFLTLFCSTPQLILCNKKRSRLYFIHECYRFSLLYNTNPKSNSKTAQLAKYTKTYHEEVRNFSKCYKTRSCLDLKKQKERRKEEKKKKKRKLPLRVLNSKWKVSRSCIGSAQNFRLR